MGPEIIIVLVVLVVAAVVLVARSRRAALPPSPSEGRSLPPGPAARDADDHEDDHERDLRELEALEAAERDGGSEDEGEDQGEDQGEDEDERDLRELEALEAAERERADEDRRPANDDTFDDDDHDVEPPAESPSGAATVDDGPKVPTFRAPGRPGTAAKTPSTPATPRAAVPLPVDKPARAAEADDAARREQERARYRQGLAKTRGGFVAKLARVFRGKPKVDADLRDQIEEILFTADIGSSTAEKLQAKVTEVLDRKEIADADAVWSVIRQAMLELLELHAPAPDYAPDPGPYVLLMIGVNGVGKTTTLGKLAAQHSRAGRKVLLVAGDTFRAAAVEQLDVWARRVGCDIHHGSDKADPSSVIFEGISRARREGHDVVLCDTAGRLHTRTELMDELAKVGRAAAKALAKGRAPQQAAAIEGAHDVFLVLDATIGQNALAQAKLFKDTIGFTGLVVTKLDGTAKGGVVLGICDELRVPIRYIGIGEGIDDLRAFSAEDFADALLADRDRAPA